MMKPEVAIIHREKVTGTPANYDDKDLGIVKKMVKEAVDEVGGFGSVIKPGDRVLIKANICWHISPDTGVVNDPRVIESVISLIKEETDPREVTLAERLGMGRDTNYGFQATGIAEIAKRAGVDRLLPLEEDARIQVVISKAKALIKPVHIPKSFLDADVIIYIPKMKTHKICDITLNMKLTQGVFTYSETQRAHRADIEQKFVDMLRVIKPDLSIVDAIWAMQGQGPGSPYPEDLIKDMNLIIAGKDPVAVDAVGAYIMGYDPLYEVGLIRGAHMEGLGVGDLKNIAIKGNVKPDEVRRNFRRPTCSLTGLHPKIDCYVGGACIGCMEFLRTGIEPYMINPETLKDIEKISFIVGFKTEVPDKLIHNPPTHYVFVVGDCTAEHKDRGIFLHGCPSSNIHMIPFIGKSEEEILSCYRAFVPEGYSP